MPFARNLLEHYKRVLDAAKEINPKMDIIITGGEALTSPLTIPVAKYIHKIGLNCNTLLTNATLIDESNVDELVSLFNKFSVSLDGSCAEVAVAMVVTKKNMHDVSVAAKKWDERFYVQPATFRGRF